MASNTPKKTGFPLLVDSDLANTLDFHIASTNFLGVVDEYANHIAASYVWNYQAHTVDPITSQAQFFQKFNDSTLHLNDDTTGQMGGIDDKVYAYGTGAYLSKLDTLLNEDEVWVRGDDNWPESKSNAGNPYAPAGSVKSYHAFNLRTDRHRWIPFTEDPQALVHRKIKNLQLNWGAEDVQEEFLLYWVQKYRRAHDKVKEEYKKYVSDERYNYFTELSDSIGLLARTKDYVDNAMLPMADVNCELYNTTPKVVHPVADDKLDTETKELIEEMSLKTNNLFRRNMSKMYRVYRTGDTAHGEDIMADYSHLGRAIGYGNLLDGTITETIGRAYKLLGYIRNADNEQRIKSPTFTIAVEDSLIRVDFLKDRINTLTSTRTNNEVLKAEQNVKDLS